MRLREEEEEEGKGKWNTKRTKDWKQIEQSP
jgi:hypothetical protein